MTIVILTIIGVAALAFANGANDVSKGVATLAGSGRASYRAALAWGTVWTFAGGVASLGIAFGLVKAFTSAIVTVEILTVPTFPFAVAIGAAAWVLCASRTGLPVSSTHALTGAIVGVALSVGGLGSVNWAILLAAVAAPLALSPVVAAVIAYGTSAATRRLSPACVCVEPQILGVVASGRDTLTAVAGPRIIVATEGCSVADNRWRFMPAGVVHWAAAAALSFGRAVNDNAKIAAIAALGLTTVSVPMWILFAATATAMTIGSYAAGLRVTRTLGERVVQMETDTGLAANIVAATLVLAASIYTLPVSTTHVATGAIVGAGVRQSTGAVEWGALRSIAAAWVITLPATAALAAIVVLIGGSIS